MIPPIIIPGAEPFFFPGNGTGCLLDSSEPERQLVFQAAHDFIQHCLASSSR